MHDARIDVSLHAGLTELLHFGKNKEKENKDGSLV